MRLKDEWKGTKFPNGGWPFVDSRTGKVFDPNAGDIRDRANQVISHRRANPHIYSPSELKYLDRDWVMAEIEDYICKVNPSLCGDGQVQRPTVNVTVMPTTPCSACGSTQYEAEMCPSCGTPRVVAYRCKQCKTRFTA